MTMNGYRRLPQVQTMHDANVRALYQRFTNDSRWSRVAADLPGLPTPPVYGGYIPDLVGLYYGALWLTEVETADSYDSEHSRAQYRAFAGSGGFILSVPAAISQDAESLLHRIGLGGLVWVY